ncbi:apolipoprotein D-like [Leptopilina heterotoma]|uniref:apolipoprotein D-like n=1 Tax=Leptopilina heterotoma TaxID=63436 RepID=UPI001CA847AA|nr:apolipoprotein D-like [Leptopilina heterotoma]XP_043465733.1 apolipoprotein D-like [Leptopilina heterotoma]
MLLLSIIFLTCTGVLSQVPGIGNCPKVKVIQDFNASKYMGLWYAATKYFAIFEFGGKCTTANYSLNSNGSVNVINRQINILTERPSTIEGIARVKSNQTEGKLEVVFPSLPGKFSAPYWILDTDYDNYAVVFSCTDLGLFHFKIVWILTRKPDPPSLIVQQALDVLKKNNLSSLLLIKTDQKHCIH